MSTTEISEKLVCRFIQIGKEECFAQLTDINSEFPETITGQFMRLRPDTWYQVAENLDKTELCALIKTLTVAEKQLPNCKAGSVSPVIWLFRKLKERFPSEQDKTADWVHRNTDNDWLLGSNL